MTPEFAAAIQTEMKRIVDEHADVQWFKEYLTLQNMLSTGKVLWAPEVIGQQFQPKNRDDGPWLVAPLSIPGYETLRAGGIYPATESDKDVDGNNFKSWEINVINFCLFHAHAQPEPHEFALVDVYSLLHTHKVFPSSWDPTQLATFLERSEFFVRNKGKFRPLTVNERAHNVVAAVMSKDILKSEDERLKKLVATPVKPKTKPEIPEFNFADVVSTSHRKRDGNRLTAQEAAIVNACLRYSRTQKDAINVRVLMGHVASQQVKRPEGFDTNDLFRLLRDSRCFRITPHGAFQSARQFAGG